MLPAELVQRVALFLPDSASFFAFLDAFSSDDAHLPRDLESFAALGQSITSRPFLWPCLHLHAPPQDAAMLAHLAVALCHVRSDKIVIHGAFDLTWLVQLLQTTTTNHCRLHLETTDRVPSITHLSTLPIVSWRVLYSPYTQPIPHAFYGMPALVELDVCVDSWSAFDLDAFFRWLSTDASRVTSLALVWSLSGARTDARMESMRRRTAIEISPTMLADLTTYIATHPVQHLSLSALDFEYEDGTDARLPAFYDALAASSTLESVSILDCHNVELDVHMFATPLPWTTLAIDSTSCMHVDDKRGLVPALRQSPAVRVLSIDVVREWNWAFDVFENQMMELVADALPHTQVDDLTLIVRDVGATKLESTWMTLRHSRVKALRLDLHTEGGTLELIRQLAMHLPAMATLERLTVRAVGWVMDNDDLVSALAHALWRSRLIVVDLANNGMPDRIMPALLAGLPENNTVRKLVLDGNALTNVGATNVIEAIRARTQPLDSLSLGNNDRLRRRPLEKLAKRQPRIIRSILF
ncbi:Aste57867_5721 [Aphanomyces stellatus]|uniref:Aste57867_5721 protein n=1 Tax=Aphanomyces stellatus TaxID=120398 RepID=A0A485KHI9_9STRA|nr:hypothetical protein As57867_005708 [Aphanomyces stellatus]VFT82755.1 Aste57867_5721 [Aphanomyces stellatus]